MFQRKLTSNVVAFCEEAPLKSFLGLQRACVRSQFETTGADRAMYACLLAMDCSWVVVRAVCTIFQLSC